MRLHILVHKGVLGFALAGLVVGSAAAQAQDKDAAKAPCEEEHEASQ